MKGLLRIIVAGLCIFCYLGCANVKTYDREKLADPIMGGVDKFNARPAMAQKIYSTKEGANGSEVTVTGGCGCTK